MTDLAFTKHDNPELFNCDVVFLATPHTVAMESAPGLLQAGVTVIDLSADYRLRNKAIYEKWYKVEHTSPDLLATAIFGLPELNRKAFEQAALQHAQGNAVLVACAGCYPTATSLAAAPVIGLSQGIVVADAISGVSGAGRSATARTHFVSANENFEAYGVTSHRHTPGNRANPANSRASYFYTSFSTSFSRIVVYRHDPANRRSMQERNAGIYSPTICSYLWRFLLRFGSSGRSTAENIFGRRYKSRSRRSCLQRRSRLCGGYVCN